MNSITFYPVIVSGRPLTAIVWPTFKQKPNVSNNSTPIYMRANCGTGLNEKRYKKYKFSEVPTEFRNNNT